MKQVDGDGVYDWNFWNANLAEFHNCCILEKGL